MKRSIDARPGAADAIAESSTLYPIEVLIGGRSYRTTRTLADLFIKSARTNLGEPGAPLTVLAHSGGVELLFIAPETPALVWDLVGGVPTPLSDWPAPLGLPLTTATMDTTDDQHSFSLPKNGSPMNSNHERILSAAYELFTHHSVHELTLTQVQEDAGVSEAELAVEFSSVDALAEECMKRRERDWTIGIVRAGARARAEDPEGRLLAIFDVFDEWFHRDDYEACTFVNVLLEMGRDHTLGRASIEHLAFIRSLVADLAREAGLREPDEFAFSWHILMKGAIVNAVEGDDKAALRAKAMGRDLIRRHKMVSTDTGSYQLDPRWALG